jgi:hypothetical protein
VQPKEENDKQYAESQQQRALERKIRAAKRAVEMGDDSPEAKARVRAAQEQMRQFIKETGRTRRPDRESLYGARKAATPPRDQRPTPGDNNGNVNPQLTTPKIEPVKVADSEVSNIAKQYGVDYNPVKRHQQQPTEEIIINSLSGGDLTSGSCASVGLAYCGQKNGLNVLDFRGGISQNVFSTNRVLEKLKQIPGIVWKETHGSYYQTTGNQLLKQCETGKQYWFTCGRHAAIVRKNEKGVMQYLELQSAKYSGWHDFHKSARATLATRFGAPSQAYLDANSYMFDIDSVKDSPEFAMILGYINTDEGKQKKGAYGTIK